MLPSPLVVFTEPLGVLLQDGRPSWAEAEEALAQLERREVPLVFLSRATRLELEFLRRRLGNRHPFISESGGGLFVPHGYFPQRLDRATTTGVYHLIAFGKPYKEVVEALEQIAAEAGAEVVGFHQMSARETAQNAGLPERMAQLARQREFDEPFFFAGETPEAVVRFRELARARGFACLRGKRFWHLSSGADAGRALRQLMEMYRAARRTRLRAVAIGAAASEFAMLAAANQAILLPGEDSEFDAAVLAQLPGAKRGAAAGAAGWNEAVLSLLAG